LFYIIKRFFILLSFLIMLILLSSCISIAGLETSFKSLMDKYPNIISITRVWGYGDGDYHWTDIEFYRWLALDIKMENEKRLFLAWIRSSDLRTPFYIELIGKSTFIIDHNERRSAFSITYGASYDDYGFLESIPIDFVAKNINIKLKSVDDVIKNYDLIYNFLNSFTKLEDIEDIDKRNEIAGYWSNTKLGYKWLRYTPTIKVDNVNCRILNVTQDAVPKYYKFERIDIGREWERRHTYYRN
jgi:hypothetical protein